MQTSRLLNFYFAIKSATLHVTGSEETDIFQYIVVPLMLKGGGIGIILQTTLENKEERTMLFAKDRQRERT